MLRLIFKERRLSDGQLRDGQELVGVDETAVLDAWNALPAWRAWAPGPFRERLAGFSGANNKKYTDIPVDPPCEDDELLAAVVDALGPGSVTLESIPGDRGLSA